MSTIDEIMEAVYRSQFAASAYEASSGPGTGKLEIDMFAADGEVQAMITAALAEARREGAEAMRAAAASAGFGAAASDENACEVMDAIEALPLPTGERQAVLLTDEQIEDGRKQVFSTDNPFCPCDAKTMRKAVRWAEDAVLTANGLEVRHG